MKTLQKRRRGRLDLTLDLQNGKFKL
jgi:hypothetical protein